ncbi:MAG: Xaa-Pro peptidase family protein [Nitrospirota bacterium]
MNRIQASADALGSRGIDGILVSDLKNVRYLSGFRGSSCHLIISRSGRILFTDFRYHEQAKNEIKGFDVVIVKGEMHRAIIENAKSQGIRTLGFESTVSYEFYRKLLRRGLRIKAVSNFVEDMRKIKGKSELELIKKAIYRAEKAFREVKPYIKKGISEKKLAAMIEENLKKRGCSALPFDIIVATGQNSSMPHARPTDNKIKAGDLVVIDWGGEAGGYFSDMTRTFLINGGNVQKKREIYETVLKANRAAIDSVREGKHSRMVDKAARDVIKKAGYGDFFGHGTGHGIGLDVHELPRISRIGGESVKKGMVFTIEPGIYVPGLGGVRIEDMVLAGETGCDVLTSLPRTPEIIHQAGNEK